MSGKWKWGTAVAAGLLLGISLVQAQTVDYGTIVVKTAPGATVSVGGTPSKQKGAVRTFYTPALPAGYKYQYEVVVTWKEGGAAKSVSKWVDVAAGKTTQVDFPAGPAKKVDDKKKEDVKKTDDKKVDDKKKEDVKKTDDKKKEDTKKTDDKKVDDKKKEEPKKADGAVKLFNGADLSGWTVFLDPKKADADPKKIFTVKDGIIVCEGSVNGYILTDKEYDNYVLTLQWRWGKRLPEKGVPNSGVFVHVTGENKIWPKAVEAQLMSGRAGDFWLVGDFKLTVDPKRQDPKVARHYFRLETTKPVENPVGEWNAYVITCKGDSVRLEINGQIVNEGTMAELSRGKILLQSEGAEIHFKDVTLKAVK